eukprot:TRINITY_DN30102_c0_g1_i1.p1 TRINITY_DN30102_c0_g1~~TRINITY_DN30102_c0_g1_i1.p1  ORF type:complete len:1631 (+),score=339.06 TRINITY_DN30102_c0_g1_i1:398-5290(+)
MPKVPAVSPAHPAPREDKEGHLRMSEKVEALAPSSAGDVLSVHNDEIEDVKGNEIHAVDVSPRVPAQRRQDTEQSPRSSHHVDAPRSADELLSVRSSEIEEVKDKETHRSDVSLEQPAQRAQERKRHHPPSSEKAPAPAPPSVDELLTVHSDEIEEVKDSRTHNTDASSAPPAQREGTDPHTPASRQAEALALASTVGAVPPCVEELEEVSSSKMLVTAVAPPQSVQREQEHRQARSSTHADVSALSSAHRQTSTGSEELDEVEGSKTSPVAESEGRSAQRETGENFNDSSSGQLGVSASPSVDEVQSIHTTAVEEMKESHVHAAEASTSEPSRGKQEENRHKHATSAEAGAVVTSSTADELLPTRSETFSEVRDSKIHTSADSPSPSGHKGQEQHLRSCSTQKADELSSHPADGVSSAGGEGIATVKDSGIPTTKAAPPLSAHAEEEKHIYVRSGEMVGASELPPADMMLSKDSEDLKATASREREAAEGTMDVCTKPLARAAAHGGCGEDTGPASAPAAGRERGKTTEDVPSGRAEEGHALAASGVERTADLREPQQLPGEECAAGPAPAAGLATANGTRSAKTSAAASQEASSSIAETAHEAGEAASKARGSTGAPDDAEAAADSKDAQSLPATAEAAAEAVAAPVEAPVSSIESAASAASCDLEVVAVPTSEAERGDAVEKEAAADVKREAPESAAAAAATASDRSKASVDDASSTKASLGAAHVAAKGAHAKGAPTKPSLVQRLGRDSRSWFRSMLFNRSAGTEPKEGAGQPAAAMASSSAAAAPDSAAGACKAADAAPQDPPATSTPQRAADDAVAASRKPWAGAASYGLWRMLYKTESQRAKEKQPAAQAEQSTSSASTAAADKGKKAASEDSLPATSATGERDCEAGSRHGSPADREMLRSDGKAAEDSVDAPQGRDSDHRARAGDASKTMSTTGPEKEDAPSATSASAVAEHDLPHVPEMLDDRAEAVSAQEKHETHHGAASSGAHVTPHGGSLQSVEKPCGRIHEEAGSSPEREVKILSTTRADPLSSAASAMFGASDDAEVLASAKWPDGETKQAVDEKEAAAADKVSDVERQATARLAAAVTSNSDLAGQILDELDAAEIGTSKRQGHVADSGEDVVSRGVATSTSEPESMVKDGRREGAAAGGRQATDVRTPRSGDKRGSADEGAEASMAKSDSKTEIEAGAGDERSAKATVGAGDKIASRSDEQKGPSSEVMDSRGGEELDRGSTEADAADEDDTAKASTAADGAKAAKTDEAEDQKKATADDDSSERRKKKNSDERAAKSCKAACGKDAEDEVQKKADAAMSDLIGEGTLFMDCRHSMHGLDHPAADANALVGEGGQDLSEAPPLAKLQHLRWSREANNDALREDVRTLHGVARPKAANRLFKAIQGNGYNEQRLAIQVEEARAAHGYASDVSRFSIRKPLPPLRLHTNAAHLGAGYGNALDVGLLHNQRMAEHRIVQRYKDGLPMGPLKVIRKPVALSASDDKQGEAAAAVLHGERPDDQVGGWIRLRYSSAEAVLADIRLDRHAGDSGSLKVIISGLVPGGQAQRCGAQVGFVVEAINGDAAGPLQLPPDQYVQLFAGSVTLDVVQPEPRAHGVPSLGDQLLKKPLATPCWQP